MFCFSVDQLCKCCYFRFLLLRLNFLSFVVCYTSLLIGPFLPRESRVALTSWTSRFSAFFAHAMWPPRYFASSKAFVWFGASSDCLLLESCGFCTCTSNRLLLYMRRLEHTVPTSLRLSLPLKILARFVYKIFLAQRSSVQNDRDFQPGRMS